METTSCCPPSTAHRPRRLQPVRGDLRPRADHRGPPGGPQGRLDPRQRGRPALARPHLPQGRGAGRRLRGPRPAATAGQEGRRRLGRGLLGRGARPDRRRPGTGDQRARAGRRRHLPRQPQRPLPRRADPRRRDDQDLQDAQQVQRQLGGPDPAPVRGVAALRPPADDPDRRHRPDVVLPGVRRQPDGLERLADDRSRLPQPAARAEEARRQDGRPRPAAHRDREGRRRAPLRAAGHRRGGAARDGARALRGGPDRPSVVRERDGVGAARGQRASPRSTPSARPACPPT